MPFPNGYIVKGQIMHTKLLEKEEQRKSLGCHFEIFDNLIYNSSSTFSLI